MLYPYHLYEASLIRYAFHPLSRGKCRVLFYENIQLYYALRQTNYQHLVFILDYLVQMNHEYILLMYILIGNLIVSLSIAHNYCIAFQCRENSNVPYITILYVCVPFVAKHLGCLTEESVCANCTQKVRISMNFLAFLCEFYKKASNPILHIFFIVFGNLEKKF